MQTRKTTYTNRTTRYTQTIGAPGLVQLRKPGRILVPVRRSPGGGTIGFGPVINPQGQRINFAQPPRGAIVGVTTVRAAPAYMGADLGRYGLNVQAAPGEKYTQQSIKKLQISLTNTFTDTVYFISGTILWYMTSTNPTDQIQIRIGDIYADQLPFGPGNGIEGLSFDKVYISNNTGVSGAVATLVYFSDTPESPARFF